MKRWLVFLLGFISGIVCTFVVAYCITSQARTKGMTFFEQVGDSLSTTNFRVMQVVGSGDCALAYELGPRDLLVLVVNDNGEYYYDDQIIHVPQGKCMRQVGVYKYPTKMDIEKTVPIVMLMDE